MLSVATWNTSKSQINFYLKKKLCFWAHIWLILYQPQINLRPSNCGLENDTSFFRFSQFFVVHIVLMKCKKYSLQSWFSTFEFWELIFRSHFSRLTRLKSSLFRINHACDAHVAFRVARFIFPKTSSSLFAQLFFIGRRKFDKCEMLESFSRFLSSTKLECRS